MSAHNFKSNFFKTKPEKRNKIFNYPSNYPLDLTLDYYGELNRDDDNVSYEINPDNHIAKGIIESMILNSSDMETYKPAQVITEIDHQCISVDSNVITMIANLSPKRSFKNSSNRRLTIHFIAAILMLVSVRVTVADEYDNDYHNNNYDKNEHYQYPPPGILYRLHSGNNGNNNAYNPYSGFLTYTPSGFNTLAHGAHYGGGYGGGGLGGGGYGGDYGTGYGHHGDGYKDYDHHDDGWKDHSYKKHDNYDEGYGKGDHSVWKKKKWGKYGHFSAHSLSYFNVLNGINGTHSYGLVHNYKWDDKAKKHWDSGKGYGGYGKGAHHEDSYWKDHHVDGFAYRTNFTGSNTTFGQIYLASYGYGEYHHSPKKAYWDYKDYESDAGALENTVDNLYAPSDSAISNGLQKPKNSAYATKSALIHRASGGRKDRISNNYIYNTNYDYPAYNNYNGVVKRAIKTIEEKKK